MPCLVAGICGKSFGQLANEREIEREKKRERERRARADEARVLPLNGV